MKKKSSRKGLTIAIISIGLLGVVGTAAALTKGFTSFFNTNQTSEIDKTSSKESERINLRTFDFLNEQNGSLNESSLLNFVNSHNLEKKEIFSEIPNVEIPGEDEKEPCIAYTYADGSLGIRLGNESNQGYFGLNCISTYKFNHAKIEAVNYYKWNSSSEQFDKETGGSTLTVNGYSIELNSNPSLDKEDSKVTKTIVFSELQTDIYFVGVKGRPCILKVELWSE